MPDYPTIEIKLLEAMAKKNIKTIKYVSDRSGLSRKAVSQALNNQHHRMKTDTIARLCGALDCDIGDLLVLKK